MKTLYILLFSLSIILINPWGNSRGEIWTLPKVFIILLIFSLNLFLLYKQKQTLTLSPPWKISRTLWIIYLGIGTLSTLESPFPLRSLFGQDQMGDGLLYWLLIAGFTLTNTLLLKIHPELLTCQIKGLVIGGIILALSIFPQSLDWRIDYTATTAQLIQPNILKSTIFQHHQPIGFYSHRGHASFVLAAVAVLILAAGQLHYIHHRLLIISLSLILPALLLAKTRAGILAFFVATAWLFGRKYSKLFIPATLICLLIIGTITGTRPIYQNVAFIKQFTSGRLFLWEKSLQGIHSRPLLGWGFNGFGTAYPFIREKNFTPAVIRLGNFSYDYIDKNQKLQTKSLLTVKAHNLILDTTLSTGILGTLFYLALLGYSLYRLLLFQNRPLAAIAVTYLIFTFTWFDCAQYTHIAWWCFSVTECAGKHN